MGQTSNINFQTTNRKPDSERLPFDLEERMTKFSEAIISFCKGIKIDQVSRPLVSQLIRSATSVGANFAEANNAVSKKDFRNKAYISKKEAQETKYWLRLLKSCYSDQVDQLSVLWKEAHELTLILQSILNKVEKGVD